MSTGLLKSFQWKQAASSLLGFPNQVELFNTRGMSFGLVSPGMDPEVRAKFALQRLKHERLKDFDPFRLRLLKHAVNGTEPQATNTINRAESKDL